MSDKLSIVIILGTPHSGHQTTQVCRYIEEQVTQRDDMQSRTFSVDQFEFPKTYDHYGDNAIKNQFPEFRDAIDNCDGIIIVSPEYNHSFPGELKVLLDILLKEYNHKGVGVVGVSSGPWGGTRMIESISPMLRELGLSMTAVDLHFPKVKELFDENHQLKDRETFDRRSEKFLNELSWICSALKWGRHNLN